MTWCASLPAGEHLVGAPGWEPRCGSNPCEASSHAIIKCWIAISYPILNIYLGVDDEGRVPRIATTFCPDKVERLEGNVHGRHARIVLVSTTNTFEHIFSCNILWPCTKLSKGQTRGV